MMKRKKPNFAKNRYIVAMRGDTGELYYGKRDRENILKIVLNRAPSSFLNNPACAIQFDDFAMAYSIANSINEQLGTSWSDVYVKELCAEYFIGNKCKEPLEGDEPELPIYILRDPDSNDDMK